MIIIDLIYNLSVLFALSALSGFIDTKFDKKTSLGKILQGLLFGIIAIIGMLYPFNLTEGIIFDGRSIVISVCTLLFGPISGFISALMAGSFRIYLGGGGVIMGVSVVTTSFLIGCIFNYLLEKEKIKLSKTLLYLFGLLVSAVMMFLMLTLPQKFVQEAFLTVTATVMVFYPLITMLIGNVIIDHFENRLFLQELNKERNLYRTTLYSIGDAVIVTDKNGKVTHLNSNAEKLTGWNEKEALNQPVEKVFNIINEYSRTNLLNPIQKVLDEGIVIGLANHTLLINKNGNEIPIADSAAPIKDKNGNILGAVLVFRDQTLERIKQRELEESEERFRTMIENAPEPIFIQINKKFAYLNPAACRLFKIENQSDLLGTPIIEKFSPEFHSIIEERIKTINVDRKPVIKHQELKAIRSDGETVWVETSGAPINYKNENGALVFMRNINERKASELALKESEEKYKRLTENAPDLIYRYEFYPKRGFTFVSNAAERITGYTPEEHYNNPDLVFKLVHPDDSKLLQDLSWEKNLTKSITIRWIRKDGSVMWTEQKNTPLYDENGNLIAIEGIARDITEKMMLEKEKFRLLNILESSLNEIYLFNADTLKFEYANKGAVQNTGYSLAELREMTPLDLKPYFNLASFKKMIDPLLSGEKEKLVFETVHKRKSGSVYDVVVHLQLFNEKNERIFFAFINDITERKRIERELKQSEEKFRSLFENHSAVKLLMDPKTGKIIDANEAASKFYGWSVNELKNKKINEINLLPLDQLSDEMQRAIDNKQFRFEFQHLLADGSVRDVEVYSSRIIIEGKTYLHSIVHDITERKIFQKKLIENEEKLSSIFRVAPVGIGVTIKRILVEINFRITEITGYSKEELIGKNVSILFVDEQEFEYVAEKSYHQIMTTGISIIETRWIKKNGEKIEILLAATPIQKEDFSKGTVFTVLDITERKVYEKELIKKSLAIEQSPLSIIITDKYGNIEYVNPFFTKLTGYTFSEAIGNNPRLLKSGEHDLSFYKNLWSTILSGKSWSGIFKNKSKNGRIFWESANISPIIDKKGNIINFLAIKEDITEKVAREEELTKYRKHLENLVEERTKELNKLNEELYDQLQKEKELEEQLKKALSKEKEINELKTRFIATVSHEFRTPLAALLSSSQMIQRYSKKWSEEKLNDHYERINSTVNYLTQLLDDVLTISRTEREVIKNTPEFVSINKLIENITNDVNTILTEKHALDVQVNCVHELIFIDKRLLRQIITNLLTNAIKYSPNGGTVKLNIESKDNVLHIQISDQGIGIDESEIKYIFEPFYRTKNSIGIQGSGLGLNIVKRALEIIGGDISVNSKLNYGTTFNLKIPLYENGTKKGSSD
ncbi:MAG: PAS domain S-box protein [Ignavibacterium album]|uniref:PAS domain S-box protein n=1 Tax=Ignavibacterium album TaxID=591197 RepID=UPI0026E9282E|nr:PAS domain S-box protein [Ignavibacterium album]MCX8104650.1 PAS domain S-box protein [Ignavibacterium album]